MKRFTGIVLGLLIALQLLAQSTSLKRHPYLGDFPSRTTMVVIPNDNYMINLLIKDAVENDWYLSPYEFCTVEQFHQMRCDTSYYFLMKVDRFSRSSGAGSVEFMSLVKGGGDPEDGLEKMRELISLPLQSEDDLGGTIFPFIPAYLDIIQYHVLNLVKAQPKKLTGIKIWKNLKSYNSELKNISDRTLLFSQQDFSSPVSQSCLDSLFQGRALLVSEEDKAEALERRMPNVLVSLVVKPLSYYQGAHSYRMLISSDTRKLYFYKKTKLTKKMNWGFSQADLVKISTPFRKKK